MTRETLGQVATTLTSLLPGGGYPVSYGEVTRLVKRRFPRATKAVVLGAVHLAVARGDVSYVGGVVTKLDKRRV